MKARIDAIIQREQAEYLEHLHPANSGLLAEMEEYAAANRVPVADREVALFLEITARAIGARFVLEIGAAIGYSVIHLAQALQPGGLLVSIEPDDVRIERGFALDIMPRLRETFDLIYIDAVKEEYTAYLDLALPLLRTGGVIIADNVLWGGQVAGEIRSPDQTASTQALRSFNQHFVHHPSLRAEILSVGDGLGYGVKVL
jgi:predicted O-methyltransferase YrrM